MIKIIAGLLGGKVWLAWLLVLGVCLGAVGGVVWYVDQRGYQRATLEWSVKYTQRENELERQRVAEIDRQAAANNRAKAAEAARVAQLRNENAQLQLQLQEHANAAAIDPDADRVGLGADSVRRIDTIGGAK